MKKVRPMHRYLCIDIARLEEEEMRGRKIGKTEARRLMERKAAQLNKKNLKLKQKEGLPTDNLRQGRGRLSNVKPISLRVKPLAPIQTSFVKLKNCFKGKKTNEG